MKEYYVIICGMNIEFIIQITTSDALRFTENKLEELRSSHYKSVAHEEDYTYDMYKYDYQWKIELCKGI